jgi:hypothetical protein
VAYTPQGIFTLARVPLTVSEGLQGASPGRHAVLHFGPQFAHELRITNCAAFGEITLNGVRGNIFEYTAWLCDTYQP